MLGLDEIVKPLSEGNYNTSITINLSLNILASYLIRLGRDRLNSFYHTQVVRLTTCKTTEYGGGMCKVGPSLEKVNRTCEHQQTS